MRRQALWLLLMAGIGTPGQTQSIDTLKYLTFTAELDLNDAKDAAAFDSLRRVVPENVANVLAQWNHGRFKCRTFLDSSAASYFQAMRSPYHVGVDTPSFFFLGASLVADSTRSEQLPVFIDLESGNSRRMISILLGDSLRAMQTRIANAAPGLVSEPPLDSGYVRIVVPTFHRERGTVRRARSLYQVGGSDPAPIQMVYWGRDSAPVRDSISFLVSDTLAQLVWRTHDIKVYATDTLENEEGKPSLRCYRLVAVNNDSSLVAPERGAAASPGLVHCDFSTSTPDTLFALSQGQIKNLIGPDGHQDIPIRPLAVLLSGLWLVRLLLVVSTF